MFPFQKHSKISHTTSHQLKTLCLKKNWNKLRNSARKLTVHIWNNDGYWSVSVWPRDNLATAQPVTTRRLFSAVEHRTRGISQLRRFYVLLYFALRRTNSNHRRRRRIATDMLQPCRWTTCMCFDLYANHFTLLTREREICHCDWS